MHGKPPARLGIAAAMRRVAQCRQKETLATARIASLEFAVPVGMRRGIIQIEVRALTASRRRKMLPFDVSHLKIVIAVLMHDIVNA